MRQISWQGLWFFTGRSSWGEVVTAVTCPTELSLNVSVKHGARCPVGFPVNFMAGCPVPTRQRQALPHLLTDLNGRPGFSACKDGGRSGHIWRDMVDDYHPGCLSLPSKECLSCAFDIILRETLKYVKNLWKLTLHRHILFLKWRHTLVKKAFLDVKASEQSWKRSHLCLVYITLKTILIGKMVCFKRLFNISLKKKILSSSNWWV